MPFSFEHLLLAAPALLFSMVAHEYAHGYAAFRQGDPTAYQLGRLTWNPVKHIDPFLTILLPVITALTAGFIFGGAKPVPVVPRNYRNFRRGDIIVSLAGVATNALLAILSVIVVIGLGMIGRAVPAASETCAILQVMMSFGIFFNIILAYFNLLPIPPLDGSHVFKYLLPPRLAIHYQQLGRFGLLILILLFTVGSGLFVRIMLPMFLLARLAFGTAFPYLIPSAIVQNPFLALA